MRYRDRRAGPSRWVLVLFAGVVAPALLAPDATPGAGSGELAAQELPVTPREGRILRQAVSLEAQGRTEEAEERIRGLLEANPASAAGIYALERVLRREERLEELLPALEAYFEAAPADGPVRRLQLQVLGELGRGEALEEAVRAWTDEEPRDVDRYRVALPIVAGALGPERALALVTRARESTGRPGALALEAGDLRARLDDPEGAVSEWAGAVGEGEIGVSTVLRRIEELPGGGGALVKILVDALVAEPTAPDRMRVAARLAVQSGWSERGVEIARRTLPLLDDRRARKGFLAELARRAENGEGGDARDAALWAYGALREEAESPSEARALDRKLAELALLAGDTARALAARERELQEMPPDSPEERRALAALVRLEARAGEIEAARQRFERFRGAYPHAPELDEVAAEVARKLAAEGRSEEAGEILAEVEGSASALERAYLHLGREEVGEAVAELRTAAEGLDPERATGAVELLTLLRGTRSDAGIALVGRIVEEADGRSLDDLDETVVQGLPDLPVDERPGIVALAAHFLDERGMGAGAARLRSRLVEEFPESVEAAEATVRLARYRAREEGRVDEAITLLEELIVRRPESAVVPEARRELERLRGRIPGSGASEGRER